MKTTKIVNEKNKQILNSISLTDVMRANGMEPERILSHGGRARYYCPLHNDSEPSFYVDTEVRNGADAPGWGCFGCGRKGFGAIALQAVLMGYDNTALTKEQECEAVQRLVDDHGVKLEGPSSVDEERRTEAISPQECEFDVVAWTREHLEALGFKVKEKAKTTNAPMNGENEAGLPLYRCSIDREFWRGRGDARTAQQWGEVIEREFRTYPVGTFVTGPVDVQGGKGGKVSLSIPSGPTYPIFAMTYPWGIKKYEPKGTGEHKWYWSKTEGIATKWYADSVASAALEQQERIDRSKVKNDGSEQETIYNDGDNGAPWFASALKDRRHPLIVTKKDGDGTPLAAKMKRLVLCAGPRDAMQIWAATDAHVVWLHSEMAGIKDGVVEEWLRALLVRMTQVACEVYICYDIDATGVACSGSIALENANVHWVRLPKEMGDIESEKVKAKSEKWISADDEPSDPGSQILAKSYKDVTDFVTNFSQIQKRFAPDLRKANPSDALMRLLKNSLTMQFWIDKHTSKKTDKEGGKEHNVRYVLSVANLLQFLEAKGIRSVMDERGSRAFYQLSYNNTYRYLDTTRTGNQLESVCRTAMLDWIDAHIGDDDAPFKANLVNTIFTGKGLDQRTMSTMPSTPINEHSWGENFDYFFFRNTAVRVTKDIIAPVAYSALPYVTNEECILSGSFRIVKQPWRIIVNPKYDAELQRHKEISKQCATPDMRAAENTRWTQWEQLWKYKLIMDRPLDEMPMHFRFLYNLGRIFWEKESFGETLTETEKQMQDMHFVNKCHAIGYAITRHRSRARQQIVHLTDYSVSDEQKASGRNGKSAVIDMLAAVRPSTANVAGKSINGSNLTLALLLGDVVAGVHSVVGVDELPDGFKAEELYNAPVSLVCKTLYKQPVTLRGEDVPKLFIASNKPFDRSSGSTKGRIYPCFTSDYYHAASDDGRWLDFAPKDEFMEQYGVQEVANGLPARLLNELRNLLLACAQFFFQQPTDTILPPAESRSVRRELYAMTKDGGLTDWLLGYFEDVPDNPHLGQPIPPQEMAISLLDSESEAVTNESIEKAKKRIMKYMKPCLNRMGIVMDPPVVLDQASYRRHGGRRMRAWLTQLDGLGRPLERVAKNQYRHEVSTGERLPRELSDHIFVHYFYRNRPGSVPTHSYTKGKEHEEGYVQGAKDTDPEAEKNNEAQ